MSTALLSVIAIIIIECLIIAYLIHFKGWDDGTILIL